MRPQRPAPRGATRRVSRGIAENHGKSGRVMGLLSQHKRTIRYLLPRAALTRFIGWRTIRPTVVK